MIFSVNNSNNRFTLRLTLTEGAYSIENNSSPVTYKLELIANTAYNFTQYRMASRVVLGGVTVHEQAKSWDKQYSIEDYGTITIASGTATFTHDTDGKKSLSVVYGIDMDAESFTPGSLSGNGTMELATIPRQASITSAPDFTDEQNPTIYYSNPLGNTVTSVEACISLTGAMDDIAYRAISKSGSSYTFNLTEAEREVLRNATTTGNTRTVYFYVRTYMGSARYLSNVAKTLTIVNANPIFTDDQVSYADVNSAVVAITENDQHIVQEHSSLTATFGAATANKGATIKEYILELNGVTKTASASGSVSFGAVNSSQDVTLSVTAKDSRGNTTTVQKNVTMLAWYVPTFTAVVQRINNYESATIVKVDARIASVDEKNEVTITYKNKQAGGDYGDEVEIENRKQNTVICDNNFDYVFSITVVDSFGGSITKEFPVEKGKFPLFIDTEKASVGINEFPSKGEALRVADGIARFEDGVKIGNEPIADFVVDEGTSGIWTYRKWNSGVAECWGRKMYTKDITTAWGVLYESGSIQEKYKSGLFIDTPLPILTATGNSGAVMIEYWGDGDNTKTPSWCAVRPMSSPDVSFYMTYYAIGKWKEVES